MNVTLIEISFIIKGSIKIKNSRKTLIHDRSKFLEKRSNGDFSTILMLLLPSFLNQLVCYLHALVSRHFEDQNLIKLWKKYCW